MQTQPAETLTNNLPINLESVHRKAYEFDVESKAIFNHEGKEIKGYRNIYRPDFKETIAVVSSKYKLVPHKEAVGIIQPLIDALGKPQERFYLEKSGARLVAEYTFRDITKDVKTYQKGDAVALRVNVLNSYNTNSALTVEVGTMVLKCLNGATAFDGLFDLRFRHTGDHVDYALPKPEVLISAFGKTIDSYDELAKQAVDHKKIDTIVLAAKDFQIVSERSIEQEKPQFYTSSNAWELFNAFTYVINHKSKSQQTGKLARFKRLNTLFRHEFASATTH